MIILTATTDCCFHDSMRFNWNSATGPTKVIAQNILAHRLLSCDSHGTPPTRRLSMAHHLHGDSQWHTTYTATLTTTYTATLIVTNDRENPRVVGRRMVE